MDDAFRDYKSKPTPDALVHLLRAHQDRVYRVCFHVLRQASDAEDAAQEALIRIARGARSLEDSESFRRWVHRVSLNSALECARKASRRRAHESRAAMKETPPPLDAETRRALFQALATLPDATRSLVLDRYAEGETLESLVAREGVTPQAVAKRLDRAREDLRKALPATLAMAFDWDRLFDAGGFAIPNLVTGSVLKAAAGSSLVAKLAIAGFLVAAAIGSGIAFAPKPETVIGIAKPTPEGYRPTKLSKGGSTTLPEISGPASELKQTGKDLGVLEARLVRFREWVLARNEERDRIRPDDQDARESFANSRHRGLILELKGLAELVSEDPETFFRFMKDPANESCVLDLAWAGFGYHYIDLGAGYPLSRPLESASLPPKVVEGFLDLLRDGTAVPRQASLFFFSTLHDRPREFWKLLPVAIRDVEPRVAWQAINLVWPSTMAAPEVVDAILVAGRTSPHVEVRRRAADAMATLQVPEAQEFLLERMETVKDPYELFSAVLAMSGKFLAASRGGAPVDEARFLQAAMSIAARPCEDGGYQKWLVGTVVYVPAARSRPVIERTLASTSDPGTRSAIANVLRAMDDGETDPQAFNKLLWPGK